MRPGPSATTRRSRMSARRQGALLVLMSPEERALIDAAAGQLGMATGSWLRMLGLEKARNAGATHADHGAGQTRPRQAADQGDGRAGKAARRKRPRDVA